MIFLELNHWKSVSISHNGPILSHLFFADDVLLFIKATRSQAIMVEGILTNFANMLAVENLFAEKVFGTSLSVLPQFPAITSILLGWDKITRSQKVGGLGNRRARESNTAMLGKLVWDIYCNSDKLWVSLLRHRYVGDKFFLDIHITQGSTVWQSNMQAIATLRNGSGYRLEVGLFPFEAICGTSTCLNGRIQDGLTCKGNLDAAPKKIIFLHWTVCHDVVPTRSLLHNKGMLDTNNCLRCLDGGERSYTVFGIVEFYNSATLLRSVFSPTLTTYIRGRYVTWYPEKSTVVVLNVDGNNFENPGISSFGGIFRRNDGS
ncbi:hypothetical protein MTR_1g041340 [Medicago truncatula]|uniref:Uncharacterized protein n=1 Tax=Medicago truncatula TaxID=3880 RepID=A0A072VGV7_MEDTR|nr:hypothetical protein MTR_1g041340 [Medicago truncatula]